MNYPAVRIEGAILSPDLLGRLEEAPGQRPTDFGLEASGKVKDEIARAWADAQYYWRLFQRKLTALKADVPATTETRNLWLTPLLALLGYQLEYQPRSVEVNGKSYALSHRVVNRAATPPANAPSRKPIPIASSMNWSPCPFWRSFTPSVGYPRPGANSSLPMKVDWPVAKLKPPAGQIQLFAPEQRPASRPPPSRHRTAQPTMSASNCPRI